jgi:hypothetical protein
MARRKTEAATVVFEEDDEVKPLSHRHNLLISKPRRN